MFLKQFLTSKGLERATLQPSKSGLFSKLPTEHLANGALAELPIQMADLAKQRLIE